MKRTQLVIALASGLTFASGALAADLDGIWTSACSTDSQGAITNQSATFAGTTAILDSTQFADSACKNAVLTTHLNASYAVGTAVEPNTIDYTIVNITAVVTNPAYISAVNQQALCGFSDWAANVEKDITGLNCGGSTIPKAGDMAYDIYQINGKQLFFGDSSAAGHDGSSAETRPTAINSAMPYSKGSAH